MPAPDSRIRRPGSGFPPSASGLHRRDFTAGTSPPGPQLPDFSVRISSVSTGTTSNRSPTIP